MGSGFKPIGYVPIGVPTAQEISYAIIELEIEAELEIAPTSATLERLLRGDRLIYLAELSPWGVSDRTGV